MKRRLFAAILSVLMILPHTAFYVSADEAELGETVFSDAFGDTSLEQPAVGSEILGNYNSWVARDVYTGEGTITTISENTIQKDGDNYVAQLKKKGHTSYKNIKYQFMRRTVDIPQEINGKEVELAKVSFKMKRNDENARALTVMLIGDAGLKGLSLISDLYGNGTDASRIMDWAGTVTAATMKAADGQPTFYNVGEWYDIELTLNKKAKTISMSVNDKPVAFNEGKNAWSTFGITSVPASIAFGMAYYGDPRENALSSFDYTKDASYQIDDVVVKACSGFASSSPKNGETDVDTATDKIDLTFNYDVDGIADVTSVITSEDPTIIPPKVTSVTPDPLNKKKVTLGLEGKFDYDKKYKLSFAGRNGSYDVSAEIEFTTRKPKLIVNEPVFTMNDADGTVNAKIRIDNEFSLEKPLTVVAASFTKNGQLNDVDYTVTAVGAEDYIEPDFTVNAVAEGKTRLLILDSFEGLAPIVGEYVFDSQGLSVPSEITSTSATSISASVDYDDEDSKTTLSGSAGDGSVALLVLKPGYTVEALTEEDKANANDMIEYIGLAEGASYSETYVPRTPVDDSGDYSAYVSGVSTPASFRVFNSETVTQVLEAVNELGVEDLRDMLKKEDPVLLDDIININHVLALNLTDYYTLTEPELVIAALLEGKPFENVSDIRTLYNTVLAEKLEYERAGKEVVTLVNDKVWSDLESLLKEKDDILKLDWTGDYQNIKNTDNFYKKMASDYTFTTEGKTVTKAIEYIRDTFSSLAKAMAKKNTASSGSGKPSNDGSKDVKLPAQTVVPPVNNEGDGATGFNDIEDVAWAEVAIKALAKKNIINGVGNGKFEPNATVTREQFVKMLVLAFELPMEFSDAPFVDVTAADWFYHYVHTAYKNGIVQEASSFGAGRAISRAEMAAMCYRAAQANNVKLDSSASLDFTDGSSIPDYAKEAVAALSKSGIINGMGDNTFAPDSSSSRAQAAKIIYGILRLKGGID